MSGRSDKELRELALDICEGRVFGSWMIKNMHDLPMVFMSVALGVPIPKDAAHLYEYWAESLPRSINGMPIFLNFKVVTKDEAEKMKPMFKEIDARRAEFLSKGEGQS